MDYFSTFVQGVNLVAGTAAAGLAGTLLYRAGRRMYDDVTERRYLQQQRRLIVEESETRNRLRRVREIQADERGRYPLLYGENGVLRDPNSLRAFTLTTVLQRWPDLDRLDWMHRQLTAMAGLSQPARAVGQLVEATSAPAVWPESISLAQMLQGRAPSIEDLVIGARPAQGDGGLEVVSRSLHELMHVLAVGASGWGKSTWLRSFLYQVARAREPVEVVAIDTSGSALNSLRGWGKLCYPVAREVDDAVAVLDRVHAEINRRMRMYEQQPMVENLAEYNRATGADLPPWIVVADESTHLLHRRGIGKPLRDVVQRARQYGIYLLLAGQTAKSTVIDTEIRDQFSSRLCCHTSPPSSRAVLDDGSASDLRQKGRFLVQLVGTEILELQGPWIEKSTFVDALSNGGARYEMPVGANPTSALPTESAGAPDAVGSEDLDVTIRSLYYDGLSLNAIQRRVFGYTGGAAYEAVRMAINGSTTTIGEDKPGG